MNIRDIKRLPRATRSLRSGLPRASSSAIASLWSSGPRDVVDAVGRLVDGFDDVPERRERVAHLVGRRLDLSLRPFGRPAPPLWIRRVG